MAGYEDRVSDPPIGEVGVIETGPHRGRYVLVDEDASGAGFHIWILEQWPGQLPNDGWDGWADDLEGLREWFADPDFAVRWTGRPAAPSKPHGHS